MSEILAAVVPPIVVLAFFVVVIRGLVLADRRERVARQKIDAEIAERRAKKNESETPS
ncbi:hypothetical protein [Pseudactinotalea terrae]|uniref:hypothetical protein n=1 Tax=Pseudactinotalea terrae TaxID=1743262 RepID=UPI0012E2AB63|nr:hypothetical protein [Pseudactinotalea terrae]